MVNNVEGGFLGDEAWMGASVAAGGANDAGLWPAHVALQGVESIRQ
ncbi:MAG: hypothetical protein HY825_03625 [Acidobacteria bacterium]|nr:hypothetical protein [Acidobacteriota bacterium]